MERCHERYGDMFTLNVVYEAPGCSSPPEHVKQVFSGDPHVLHAGEGNGGAQSGPRDNSLLLLDDEMHMRHRKLMLPSFHGERMQR